MQKSLELNKQSAQKLAIMRLEEARILFDKGYFSGAYYLAGYSIELAIKAVICKQFKSETIPNKKIVQDIHQHDLSNLMNLSGLLVALEEAKKNNTAFSRYWAIVIQWSEHSRYEIKSQQDAKDILEAIDHQQNGILVWIHRHY